MTEWILSSSILILVVIGLRTVFKGKISLRLQYAIWGLVLLRLLIPVSFGSTSFSVANLAEERAQDPVPIISATTDLAKPTRLPEEMLDHVFVEKGNPGDHQVEAAEKNTVTFLDAAPFLWVIGFISVAGLFLITNARFKRKIMDSRYALDIRKENLDVYVSGEIDTPCLFGIRNPAIYVTYPVVDDPTLLRHTLEHEATHHRHGDHIWAILRCVCLAIHWYNPLVWWAAFLSQRDAELACDESTIRRLGEDERAAYGRTLIGMTCRKKATVLITATTMNSGKSGLKERIVLIAKKPKMAVYTLAAVALIAAIAVGCTFTGAKDDSTGDLTGTKVFTSESEVIGMGIHAHLDAYTLVDSTYLSDVIEWTSGFEYGEIMDSSAGMEPGSNTFSVTLFYADGTEKTCNLDYEIVGDITYKIERKGFPVWWNDVWPAENTQETDPKPTDAPDNAPPVNIPEMLHEQPDPDKVCIQVLPTGSISGEHFMYIIPENQELLMEYYQSALAHAAEDLMIDSNLSYAGWWIKYQDKTWYVMSDGSMQLWSGGAIASEYAKELYDFCTGAMRNAGIGEPVRPEDITDLKSATLSWDGVGEITLTDKYALNQIESLFTNSRASQPGMCWLTDLILELESGETLTLSVAADGCAYWMSNGAYYGFGEVTNVGIGGSEVFYSLFATDIIHEKAKESADAMAEYWVYMNWGLYANKYGHEDTMNLLYMFEDHVLSNPTDWNIYLALTTGRGLDGAYAEFYSYLIGELFEAAPGTFQFACRQMVPEKYVDNAVNMLAYHWGISVEEAQARVNAGQ